MKRTNLGNFNLRCGKCDSDNVNIRIIDEKYDFAVVQIIKIRCLSCGYKFKIK